jgi:hypothetical protein
VGAKSLDEDNTLFLSPVPVPDNFFDPVLPTSALRSMLPLVPREDTREPELNPLFLVATDDRVPIDDGARPVMELFRLTVRELVPIEEFTLLLLLLDETDGTGAPGNEGIGDLEREEDEIVEVNPPLLFTLPSFNLIEGTLLGLTAETDVERRHVGAIDTFFAGWKGACLCTGSFDTGMLGATVAVAGAFPRFHTFWTMDFAEERKPKRDALGLSGARKDKLVDVRISMLERASGRRTQSRLAANAHSPLASDAHTTSPPCFIYF